MALTKTWANSRLQGPDAVLTMLKFLQRKLSGKILSYEYILFLLCTLNCVNDCCYQEGRSDL